MKLRMRLHGYLKDEQWTAMDGTQLNPALPDISMTTSGNQDAYFRAVYMDNGVGEHKFFVPVTESERIEHESIQSKTITEIQRQIYGSQPARERSQNVLRTFPENHENVPKTFSGNVFGNVP